MPGEDESRGPSPGRMSVVQLGSTGSWGSGDLSKAVREAVDDLSQQQQQQQQQQQPPPSRLPPRKGVDYDPLVDPEPARDPFPMRSTDTKASVLRRRASQEKVHRLYGETASTRMKKQEKKLKAQTKPAWSAAGKVRKAGHQASELTDYKRKEPERVEKAREKLQRGMRRMSDVLLRAEKKQEIAKEKIEKKNAAASWQTPTLSKVLKEKGKEKKDSSAQEPPKQMRGDKIVMNYMDLEELELGDQQRLEFLYLRDNALTKLNGSDLFPLLRVLDVCNNAISSLGFLEDLPFLRELWISQNLLVSLEEMPTMQHLEVLSLTSNEISSWSGLGIQPNLTVLSLAGNKIGELMGMPLLPKLWSLRLDRNPIVDTLDYRSPVLLACGKNMEKLDGRIVDADERVELELYPIASGVCIRQGWIPSGNTESAFEEITEFVNMQQDGHKGTVELRGTAMENRTLTAIHTFPVDEDAGETVLFKWLRADRYGGFEEIEDATTNNYTCRAEDIGYCISVHTAIVNPDGELLDTVYALSADIVAAMPEALWPMVSGIAVEGQTLTAEVQYMGGEEGESQFRWLHFSADDSEPPKPLHGTSMTYVLSLADVGHCVGFEYTPVRVDGKAGITVSAKSPVVQCAPPSVSQVKVVGTLAEGSTLKGDGIFFGGVEADSRFQWYRSVYPSGTFEKIEGACYRDYTAQLDDVYRCLMFEYIPCSQEAGAGPPVTFITEPVGPAVPRIKRVRILGELTEHHELTVTGEYSGGLEGSSIIEWFRVPLGGTMELITSGPLCSSYLLCVDDVDCQLRVHYTPVRNDGVRGEQVVIMTRPTVAPSPPKGSIKISDTPRQGLEVRAITSYVGGKQGKSVVTWFRSERPVKDSKGPGDFVQMGTVINSAVYVPVLEDVGHLLKAEYLPVREDGETGDCCGAITEPVKYGWPQVVDIEIRGNPVQNGSLYGIAKYWGGIEGASKRRWIKVLPDGSTQVVADGVDDLFLTGDDVGCNFQYHYTPIRDDGVRGQPATATSRKVKPAVPQIENVQITGTPTEGQVLRCTGEYFGGVEGKSVIRWKRRLGANQTMLIREGSKYRPNIEDVGCTVIAEYTPVRYDNVAGQPMTASTPVISHGEPKALEFSVPEFSYQDLETSCIARYFGGHEGPRAANWYRMELSGADPRDIDWSVEHITTKGVQVEEASTIYTPRLDDVGCILGVVWVPTRDDGATGSPVYAMTWVRAAAPAVSNVHHSRVANDLNMLEGHGDYYGGREGASTFAWQRLYTTGKIETIRGATSLSYEPGREDYQCKVRFCYTPVRDDGAVGDTGCGEWSGRILPDLPELTGVELSGSYVEGGQVIATPILSRMDVDDGWISFKFEWFAVHPETDEVISRQVFSDVYTCRQEDSRHKLQCVCTMVDFEGSVIQTVEATSDAISPGLPQANGLKIDGDLIEGSFILGLANYYGGYEGHSICRWFRVAPDGSDEEVFGERNYYQLRVQDIGCSMRFEFTPVRDDGERGQTEALLTDAVSPLPPTIVGLKVAFENAPLYTNAFSVWHKYRGGREGMSLVQWYIQESSSETSRFVPIPNATEEVYQPGLDDIGRKLRVEYIPIRDDGVRGTPAFFDTPAIQMDPEVNNRIKASLSAEQAEFGLRLNSVQGEPRWLILTPKEIRVKKNNKVEFKSPYTGMTRAYPTDSRTFTLDVGPGATGKNTTYVFASDSTSVRDYVILSVRAFAQQWVKMAQRHPSSSSVVSSPAGKKGSGKGILGKKR